MRAIVARAFGAPDVLESVETDRPTPMPNEVLVRVHAAGVNPVDAKVRSGDVPLLGEPPFTVGWDISGVVAEVGFGVTRFALGDEVYGMPFFPRQAAGYAEYVAAPSRQLARKPASLSHVSAAGLPLAGLTAWQGLVDAGEVAAGQRVLIHGAGGGVGHVAVQIAKARGAHVIATASEGKHDFVRKLGADELIDYRAADFAEVVSGVDVVLDTVGGEYGERSLRTLRPGGRIVTILGMGDADLAAKAGEAGVGFAGVMVEPDYAGLAALSALVDEGRLVVHVEHVLPLQEAGKAHELIEAGARKGKIVLSVR